MFFANSATIDELVDGVFEGILAARSPFNITGTQIVLQTPVGNLIKLQLFIRLGVTRSSTRFTLGSD
jgi:hypothetical protein